MNVPPTKYHFPASAKEQGFISPEEQRNLFVEHTAGRMQSFSLAELMKLPEPPSWPETPHRAVVLEVNMKLSGSSFDDAWAFVENANRSLGLEFWRWDQLFSTSNYLRLGKGVPYEPGARWVLVDFQAYVGGSSSQQPLVTISNMMPRRRPGSVLVQSMAYFPNYFKAVRGMFTSLWIPGFEYSRRGDDEFGMIPIISFEKAGLTTAALDAISVPEYYVPPTAAP